MPEHRERRNTTITVLADITNCPSGSKHGCASPRCLYMEGVFLPVHVERLHEVTPDQPLSASGDTDG